MSLNVSIVVRKFDNKALLFLCLRNIGAVEFNNNSATRHDFLVIFWDPTKVFGNVSCLYNESTFTYNRRKRTQLFQTQSKSASAAAEVSSPKYLVIMLFSSVRWFKYFAFTYSLTASVRDMVRLNPMRLDVPRFSWWCCCWDSAEAWFNWTWALQAADGAGAETERCRGCAWAPFCAAIVNLPKKYIQSNTLHTRRSRLVWNKNEALIQTTCRICSLTKLD